MKKVSLILAALALVLGISQCKKQENPVASGEKQHIVLNASFGDSNAKIDEDGTGGLKWAVGDLINVSKDGQSLSDEGLICTDAAKGIFEGEITETTGDITFTFGELKLMEQTGELNDAISLSATAPYDKSGNYDVKMTMTHAVLKLDLSALGTETGTTVTISNASGTVATVTGVKTTVKVYYVAMSAAESTKYTFSGNGKRAEKTWPLAANTFYTANGPDGPTGEAFVIVPDAPTAPEGALPGVFTVSADGKKVHFSEGNLYYDGSNWGFEEEQYYFRTYNGKGKCDANGYSKDSGTGSGHWGLFGWSTEGKNFGMSTSTSYSDYSGNFLDWGTTIDNKGTWTTLSGGSDGEWKYLFDHHVHVWGTCNNVPGRFIAPDGFVGDASALSDAIKDWGSAQAAGIVFLPAAGRRDGSDVGYVGDHGRYWSSSAYDEYSAYRVFFSSGSVDPGSSLGDPIYGFSVRLITESK